MNCRSNVSDNLILYIISSILLNCVYNIFCNIIDLHYIGQFLFCEESSEKGGYCGICDVWLERSAISQFLHELNDNIV